MRFLVDMNLSPLTVAALRSQGWDMLRVSEVLPVDAADLEILEWARRHNRIVVTQDLDFSALVALGGYSQPSLVTLRLSTASPETVTARLLAVIPELEEALESGCAVTVGDASVRLRLLPIQ